MAEKSNGAKQDEPKPSDPLQNAASSGQEFENMEAVFDKLGGIGRYNILVLAAMIFCNLFPGMITLSANFTAADVAFNCTDYGVDNVTLTSCQPVNTGVDSLQCGMTFNCSHRSPEKMKPKMTEYKCQKFEFADEMFQETAVSRFHLVCDRAWMAKLATTFFFIGFLLGCSLYGALADKFGRLRAMAISLVNMSACVIGASHVPLLGLYWTLQLLTGMGVGGFLSCTFSYALENTDAPHRSVWGLNLHNGWTSGIFLGTLIAYFVRHYQNLLLYYGLSVAAAIPALLLLSESPRWLVSSGRYERADSVLRRIARLNGRPLNENFSSEAASRRNRSNSALEDQAEGGTLLDLFRRPGLRRVTGIVWGMFFNVSLAYYGISLGIGDLGGSIFLNQLIAAAVEIPARLLGMLASYRIGRRLSIMIAFGLAGVCLAVTAFLVGQSHLTAVRIACAMTGKFWITLAFDLAWLYSAEVFPTVVRSLGVGTGSACARAGAMVSTLVPVLGSFWQPLPFLILAVGPLTVVLLAIVVPETKGRRLADTLDEGELLARGKDTGGSSVSARGKSMSVNNEIEL